jgi:beta-lactamase class A
MLVFIKHRGEPLPRSKRLFRRFLGIALLPALLGFAAQSYATERVCNLGGARDAALQEALVRLADEQGLTPAAERGDLAIGLLILTDPDHRRLAQINGNEMVYAASLPKIAILLGAAVAIDEGQLKPDWALQQDIQNMIRYSCNDCANRVLRKVGREHLLEVLQRPDYAFYDRQRGGGLWVGKEYGPTPAYRRDPLHGISHGATVFEVARFYCALQQHEMVSPEQDRMMMEALSRPALKHKFVKALSKDQGLDIYRKSGTWKDFHADSALVHDGNDVYVMVALAHNPQGAKWLEGLAEPLRRLATAQATTQTTALASRESLPAAASGATSGLPVYASSRIP